MRRKIISDKDVNLSSLLIPGYEPVNVHTNVIHVRCDAGKRVKTDHRLTKELTVS